MKRAVLRRHLSMSGLKSQLDALCREVTFLRDGHRCVRCGSPARIQWCHVRSRRYLSTRWSLENVMSLCAGCHLWWHHEPMLSSAWFREQWPDRADYLAMVAATSRRPDYAAVRLFLEAEKRRLTE